MRFSFLAARKLGRELKRRISPKTNGTLATKATGTSSCSIKILKIVATYDKCLATSEADKSLSVCTSLAKCGMIGLETVEVILYLSPKR